MLLHTAGRRVLLPLVVGRRLLPIAASSPAAAAASPAALRAPAVAALTPRVQRLSTTAAPLKKKGKTPPTRDPAHRISPATLEGLPPAAVLDALRQKCEGKGNLPRLSDFHALLEAVRRDAPGAGAGGQEAAAAAALQGLDLLVRKNVEFREETAAIFLRAMCRADALPQAVDALLNRGKRLGIWAPRKTLNMALHKLGQAKDTERLLKLYGAMELELGVARTARSVHLAVRGLVASGAVEEAAALAAEAGKAMPLADSTKEILAKAQAEAAAAAPPPQAEKEEAAAEAVAEGKK